MLPHTLATEKSNVINILVIRACYIPIVNMGLRKKIVILDAQCLPTIITDLTQKFVILTSS